MSREVSDLIGDIREATARALRYANGLSKGQFEADDKTVDAVLRCLTVIGEAAKRIPESERSAYPEVPWRRITGLRDRVVHDYLGSDLNIVWEVLQEHLPELTRRLPET